MEMEQRKVRVHANKGPIATSIPTLASTPTPTLAPARASAHASAHAIAARALAPAQAVQNWQALNVERKAMREALIAARQAGDQRAVEDV